MRDELRRVAREFADGITRLARTPRALGPITSITLDQVGQGIVLVLSLFVFRDRFEEGVGSFSNLIGAGGVGVLLGILTVGKLEERLPEGTDRRARVPRRRPRADRGRHLRHRAGAS